jgi:hypothetical protein
VQLGFGIVVNATMQSAVSSTPLHAAASGVGAAVETNPVGSLVTGANDVGGLVGGPQLPRPSSSTRVNAPARHPPSAVSQPHEPVQSVLH